MSTTQKETACIACQKTNKNLPTKQIRRDLCDTHYQAFMRDKARFSKEYPPEVIEQWEEMLIKEGLLGEGDGRKKRGSGSIYAEKFEEMLLAAKAESIAAEAAETFEVSSKKGTRKPKP